MESAKIQSQTKPRTPEEKCFHTPDLLEHLGSDYTEDEITQTYRCLCGRIVEEIFTHSHTNIFK